MSFRFDPFTESWVAIAPHRRRIAAPFPAIPMNGPEDCPFCPGHEAETEETVLAIPEPKRWRVRVVRNRFPIVEPSAARTDFDPAARAQVEGFGFHEVLIESPRHDADLATLDREETFDVLRACRDRVTALRRIDGIAHVALFRNKGRRAGSSQAHPHMQIAALAFVPSEVQRRAEIARAYAHGISLLEAEIAREHNEGTRVVENGAFTIVCPFASHRAFETWIVPTTPTPFHELDEPALTSLSLALLRACRALAANGVLSDYNLVFRWGPVGDRDTSFRIEILPRTGGPAGFELATGVDIATVAPEDAAARLRESLSTLG